MRIKTSELTGPALDWAVSKCQGDEISIRNGCLWVPTECYSTDWAHGGPIIEREELSVEPLYTAGGLDCWVAFGHNLRYDAHGNYIQGSDNRQYGPTSLVAAMRCFVASKLGDTVEIPKELS